MKRITVSIRQMIGIAAVSFMLFALATGIIVSMQYSRTMGRRQQEETISAFETASNQISLVLNRAKSSAIAGQMDQDVLDYFWRQPSDNYSVVTARINLQKSIETSINRSQALQGLIFLSSDGLLHGYCHQWTFFDSEGRETIVKDERLTQIMEISTPGWIAPFQFGDLTMRASTPVSMDNVLILCAIPNQYHLRDGQRETIVTLAAVDPRVLLDCFGYLQDDDETIYLVNEAGECILSAGDAWQQGVVPCWSQVVDGGKKGSVLWNNNGESQYVTYHVVPSTGWYLIKTTPVWLYDRDITAIHKSVIIITVGILLLMALFWVVWTYLLMTSMRKIVEAMDDMRRGNLQRRIPEAMGIREYEIIRRQFNDMADSIERLIGETVTMEERNATLEARTLQTQLSPHMIFNSISSIRWMATLLGVDQISDMLGALTELLKPVFREWRLAWTRKEEIEHLKHYITLLQLRCGGALEVQISVPDELMECTFPCFILQPILENSFEHSLNRSGMIRVKIEARADGENDLTVCSEDNGQGMLPERLAMLREQLNCMEGEKRPLRGIGLYNVHRKIQLLYGAEYGLNLESEPEKGTTVLIRVPRKNEKR